MSAAGERGGGTRAMRAAGRPSIATPDAVSAAAAPAASPRGLGTLLRELLARLDGDVERMYGETGLEFRPKYYPVARLLLAEPRVPLARIAATAGVTHSAASQTVAEMARHGLVTLRPGTADARERRVALTPKGQRVCAALAPLWAAVADAATALDEELAADVAPLSAVTAAALAALARRPFADRVREALDAAPHAAPDER
jgi:DNA-binding MarR family transcriptional regulator